MNDFALVGAFVAAVMIGLFTLVGVPIWVGTYYTQKSSCHSFGTQSGRDTKFVVLVKVVAPIEWDCFVHTDDGRWIPRKNLREFGEES